jgi:hypothetical protein
LSLSEFWENNSDYGDMDILATNHGSSEGWLANKEYSFHLDFNLTSLGDIRIIVKDGSATLWDVSLVDTTFSSGQFGFYNYSQQAVTYAGFEQTGGVIVDPVPEPTTLLLFGTGLAGIAGMCRRKKIN